MAFFGCRLNECFRSRVLVRLSAVFQQVVSRSSDCVARYGGEEFAFILPNTTTEGAHKVAQRIHEQIHELAIEHGCSNVSNRLTVSIGFVSYVPHHGDEPEMGVAMADSALYQAKADGRDRTHLHPSSY